FAILVPAGVLRADDPEVQSRSTLISDSFANWLGAFRPVHLCLFALEKSSFLCVPWIRVKYLEKTHG
ncbi:MAG TPA: hypothetical protein VKM96_06630, partial [Candidatus Bathyarchaeia archaeon]|nr:hypothetical protein [Candidatus Bathyarchaeia archaeon]